MNQNNLTDGNLPTEIFHTEAALNEHEEVEKIDLEIDPVKEKLEEKIIKSTKGFLGV